jgi:hypothetical protein
MDTVYRESWMQGLTSPQVLGTDRLSAQSQPA